MLELDVDLPLVDPKSFPFGGRPDGSPVDTAVDFYCHCCMSNYAPHQIRWARGRAYCRVSTCGAELLAPQEAAAIAPSKIPALIDALEHRLDGRPAAETTQVQPTRPRPGATRRSIRDDARPVRMRWVE